MYTGRFGMMAGFLLLALLWAYLMQIPHVVK